MSYRFWIVLAMLIGVLITPDSGSAKQKPKHQKHHAAKGEKYGHEWKRRGEYEYRIYRPADERPPGWNRGNKTGWRDCGLPPGQAKKYGCYTYLYEGRRHYYYEDERGRIYERRPVIEVQGSVDIRQ